MFWQERSDYTAIKPSLIFIKAIHPGLFSGEEEKGEVRAFLKMIVATDIYSLEWNLVSGIFWSIDWMYLQ